MTDQPRPEVSEAKGIFWMKADEIISEMTKELQKQQAELDALRQQLAEAEAGSKVWEQSAQNISAQLTVAKELCAEAEAEREVLLKKIADLERNARV